MDIKLAIALSNRDNYLKDITHPWEKLIHVFTDFGKQIIRKDRARCFIAGHFNGKQRLTQNLLFRSMLTLDVDNYNSDLTHLEDDLKANLKNYMYLAYSTASHVKNTPKIRILIPFEKDIKTQEYKNIAGNFINTLSFKDSIDINASTTPNQLMYFPMRTNEEYEPWFIKNNGLPLNSSQFNLIKPELKNNNDNLIILAKNKPLDITEEKVKESLNLYPAENTNYHEWLNVGMALHHQYQGHEKGLNIFLEWSLKDNRFPKNKIDNEAKQKWKSFELDNTNPLTFATIIQKVKDKTKKIEDSQLVPKELWIDVNNSFNPLSTEENLKILLDFYNIKITFDVITKDINITINNEKISHNSAITKIKSLCIKNRMNHNLVNEYINYYSEKNQFNSWKEWIESKPHDGISRFNKLCESLQVDKNYENIRDLYLKKWLIQMIHVTCLNDELKPKQARMVLVFQGGEHIGKSTWFKYLVPQDMSDYVSEVKALNVSNDMEVLACIKHVFIELAEINATFNKSDSENLKNFISRTTDIINMKYVAMPQRYRRRTVFCGSVNHARFLSDDNENTRFLVIPVINCNAFHNLDMQQLYAEIYNEAKHVKDYNLNREEMEKQKLINRNFIPISSMKEKLQDIFDMESDDCKTFYTATKVLEKLGYQTYQIKKAHTNEMARILDEYGFRRVALKQRGWYLPPLKQQLFDDIF